MKKDIFKLTYAASIIDKPLDEFIKGIVSSGGKVYAFSTYEASKRNADIDFLMELLSVNEINPEDVIKWCFYDYDRLELADSAGAVKSFKQDYSRFGKDNIGRSIFHFLSNLCMYMFVFVETEKTVYVESFGTLNDSLLATSKIINGMNNSISNASNKTCEHSGHTDIKSKEVIYSPTDGKKINGIEVPPIGVGLFKSLTKI